MLSRKALAAFAVFIALFLLPASPAAAQDPRGSITGTVADTTAGVLPGVTVTVRNVGTGVEQNVVTDGQGRFQVLYLNPGTYTVTAELSGFKKAVRDNTRVGVSDVVRVELVLEDRRLEETVVVKGEAPLLNTSSGISGTTIDNKQIAELPLGDGTAYMLSRLAPGIMDSSDLHFSRPADNGTSAASSPTARRAATPSRSTAPRTCRMPKGVGFSPPSGAISEFKVQTNAFDAQTGHTAGAVVNLALRSGTNAFNGEASYFNRNDSRTAMPLLTKRAGGDKPTREYNRYTGTVSGPIIQNKTFFMGSFEHLRDVQPEPASYTVPTEKMRQGDLSEFATAIYDPYTATSAGVRTAFAGNLIPTGRINPVAAAYAAMYPLPNRPGLSANYFTNQLRPYDYNSTMGRVDHNFTANHRMFVTGYWNKRREDRYNWADGATNATGGGMINEFAVTKGYDYRANLGVTVGYTAVLQSSLLLDIRGSGARFDEYRDPAQTFDPATLGFSSSAAQLMGDYKYLPFLTFGAFSTTNSNSTIASLGAQRSDWGDGFSRPMDTYSVQPTLTKVSGGHTMRTGYDFRTQIWNITSNGYPAGRYQFNGAYTRANNSAATNDRGQVWAQFLLGLPTALTGAVATPGTTSSQFEIASPGSFTQTYHGLFFQDDWRVSEKLTVNAGMRLEINAGMSEAENRNLAGYDFVTPNPIEPAAKAAYALNPIAQIPVSDFKATGGLLFADGPVNKTTTKVLPRVAAAYMINDRTVVRGGVGLFSYDYFFENINQAGFSQATPVLTTNDNGITFTGATLSNPIPSGQLIQPVGNALGLASQLGQNLNTVYQANRETPYYTRWEASLQHDFAAGWVTSFTYVGSVGTKLPVAHTINGIPTQYLSTSRSRDTANESFLSANVANPFAGLLAGSTINGATVARSQLLRPYPHFGGTFAVEEYTGSDSYEAGTAQVQKRFSGGNSMTAQYTYSRTRDKLNYLNPADGILEDRVSPNDRPHRFSIGGVLSVPFGKGQTWGNDANGFTDALLGGWQLSATYQYQSGAPLVWNNSLYYDSACGDPTGLKSNIGAHMTEGGVSGISGLDFPAWDVSCFYFHDSLVQTNGVDDPVKQRADQRIQMGNTVRYFPSTLPHVRTDDLHLLDLGLSKNFSMTHGMKLQLRLEAINALNYTVLWTPNQTVNNSNFGIVSTDRNSPRDFQIGLRFTF